ncbi:unnamed protein product, partial [Symbiodinium microadriaticum]
RKKDVEFEQAKLRESEDLARKEATIETKKQQDLQKRRSQYRQELVDQMVMRQAGKLHGQMVREDAMSEMEIALNK